MAKQLTFSRETSGKWYVSFAVEETVPGLPPAKQAACGIDLGVKHLLTVATDAGVETVENPRLEARFATREKPLRQRLARQQRGSNRRERTKDRLARLTERKANCRSDWNHKTTIHIVRENQAVALEDLNVKGMTANAAGTKAKPGTNVRQKAGLNRSILDASFGELRRQLEYKAKWYGRTLVTVDRFAPTSKKCSACGHLHRALTLAERVWTCQRCRTTHDRDANAAANIRALALETLHAPGGTGADNGSTG